MGKRETADIKAVWRLSVFAQGDFRRTLTMWHWTETVKRASYLISINCFHYWFSCKSNKKPFYCWSPVACPSLKCKMCLLSLFLALWSVWQITELQFIFIQHWCFNGSTVVSHYFCQAQAGLISRMEKTWRANCHFSGLKWKIIFWFILKSAWPANTCHTHHSPWMKLNHTVLMVYLWLPQ